MSDWLRKAVRQIGQLLILLVAVGVAFLGIYTAANSLIDDDDEGKQKSRGNQATAAIVPTRSSWIEGQASLASYDEFTSISDRATPLGIALSKARDALIAAIEKARLKEDDDDHKKALRAFRRAQRAAQRAYERALAAAERKAAALERKQERAEEKARQELEEELARLREKYKVEPGEECSIPEIAAIFDCSTGYPDLDPPKKQK